MEVWKTDVIKEFPFPEIKGERLCPEALVWNRTAQKYKRYWNVTNYILYRDKYSFTPVAATSNII